MFATFSAYAARKAGNGLTWPFFISLSGHLILFGLILFNPQWKSKPEMFMPSVIDVQMVDLTDAAPPATTSAAKDKVSIEEKPSAKEETCHPSSIFVGA